LTACPAFSSLQNTFAKTKGLLEGPGTVPSPRHGHLEEPIVANRVKHLSGDIYECSQPNRRRAELSLSAELAQLRHVFGAESVSAL
jgi:hypothetical protein